MLATAAVVALKLADVAAAATVTEAGTVRVELVLDKVTVAPPVAAAWLRVMVQALAALGPRLPGVQAKENISTGATRLTLALAELLL